MRLPLTIKNGAGESLTFERVICKNGVDVLEGYTEVSPGAGPPMHVHYQQEEGFDIVEGIIGYQLLGEEPRFAEAGQSIVFPAGVAHRFWNAGTERLYCRAYVTPPGNLVFFLAEIFRSMQQHGGKPGLLDAAYLLHRYRNEFGMNEIPSLVQKTVFPLLRSWGLLTGQYRKYQQAPVPLTGSQEISTNVIG